MKLVRNTTKDGRCRYALVRLDKIRNLPMGTEMEKSAARALDTLAAFGFLEYGEVGSKEEHFVIKLRDHFAPSALNRYRQAVLAYATSLSIRGRSDEAAAWLEYSEEVGGLVTRSMSKDHKLPD